MESNKKPRPKTNWFSVGFWVLLLAGFMIIMGTESSTTPIPTTPQSPAVVPATVQTANDSDSTGVDETDDTTDLSNVDTSYMDSLQNESAPTDTSSTDTSADGTDTTDPEQYFLKRHPIAFV